MNRGATRTGSTTYLRAQRLIAWQRDGGRCVWCGRQPHQRRCSTSGCGLCFEADHLIHHSNGGSDHHSNLLTACRDCNQSRGTHTQPKHQPNATLAQAASRTAPGPMAGVRRQW